MLACKTACDSHQCETVPASAYGLSLSCDQDEDIGHLLPTCPRAHRRPGASSTTFSRTLRLSASSTSFLLAAVPRTFGKDVDHPLSTTIRSCIEDVRLWAYRCSTATSSNALYNWCVRFDPPRAVLLSRFPPLSSIVVTPVVLLFDI
jgi:hypothetical protein